MVGGNNAKFKQLRAQHKLTVVDVVEIVALGGMAISKSRANGWGRGAGAYRAADQGSHDPSDRERRMKIMRDDELAAFERGLSQWLSLQ